ncbi:MAG: transglutaminaseTgpA domain-containing protein [Gaiellales bacterium]
MTESRWHAVRTGIALAVTTALLVVAWLSLARPGPGLVEVGRIVGLALVPALVTVAFHRVLAGIVVLPVVLLVAAGLALGPSVTDMRPGERDFLGPMLAAVGDGFDAFYRHRMPFDPAEQPEMAGLVLMAVFLFVTLTALLLAAGRSLLAGLVFIVGVGWPATIEATIPGSSPLRTGALLLGAVLLLLFLTREGRRPVRALGAAAAIGVALVAVSVGASTSEAVAKAPYLESWQTWNFEPDPEPVGVRYAWASNYSGISFPEEETVVLRVKAADRALYWRATTLDEFTGVGWREALAPTGAPAVRKALGGLLDPAIPRLAKRRASWTRQDVTIEALADTHLVGAAAPIRWELAEPAALQYTSGGVVLVPNGLKHGQTYTVWSYAPSVRPKLLAELPAAYPASVSRYLEVLPDVPFPEFGADGRGEQVEQLFSRGSGDPLLSAYEPVYRQAREVAGDAQSPYVVAATLELWFRSEGGFVYEERPEQPVGSTPPLADFVLRTREGYCQHYAGAMALMLRMLGIPARVAAGFTSGKYDANRDEWVVTDHNAHTWVEVWFPKYGWLSFDPTPGRGRLATSYSTSSETFNQSIRQLARSGLGLTPTLARIANVRGEEAAGPTAPSSSPAPVADPSGGGVSRGLAITALAVAGLLLAVGLVAGLKAGRRRLRYVSKDPRGVSAACRRELVAFLADRRIAVDETTTLEELSEVLRRRFRVDASAFAAAAERARFGPPDGAAEAAVQARRELRALEREIRRQQSWTAQTRGALSLRSLTA